MRPIAIHKNVTKYPLDDVFGAPANVRLLRVLADTIGGPVSASDAAKVAGVTLAGARRALDRLVKTGFVRRVGGRRSLYELSHTDPIMKSIQNLFRCESDRYHAYLSRLREVLTELPEVRVAWIESPPIEPGKPFHIGILSDVRSLAYLREQIRKRVAEIEKEYDVVLEVHMFSEADVPELDWDKTKLLAGHTKLRKGTSGRTHADRDARAARFSTVIVKMLDEDPGLMRRATKHVELLLQQDQGHAAHDLREWHDILTNYSGQRVRDFIVSDTPRAQRLRQSSPFFAVLSADEREKIFSALEAET
jgi:sugar-specific transcriptional regulator TrmB